MVARQDSADELAEFSRLMRGDHRYELGYEPDQVDPAVGRRRRRRGWIAAAIVVAIVFGVPGAYAAWALNAPLGEAVGSMNDPADVVVPAVALDLPEQGAAAISVTGADEYLGPDASGIWASSGGDEARPIASITKLVTAMVVLDAHPLADAGDRGPTITFDRDDHALYDKYYVMDATIAPMPIGTSMSLRDALATMLVPSASNYAEAVAGWAFGSQSGFVRAADRWLDANGMTSTTIVEPTGLDPANTSTTADLITLGRLASAQPTIAELSALRSVTVPGAGSLVTTNLLLGDMGVDGLKTGTLEGVGANLLYTSTLEVGIDEPLRIVGVVLGGYSQSTVNKGVRSLLGTIQSGFETVPLGARGASIGTYSTPWGSSTDVVLGRGASILAWAGTTVTAELQTRTPETWRAGEVVGELTWTTGADTVSVPVELDADIELPTAWWRLTHPGELG